MKTDIIKQKDTTVKVVFTMTTGEADTFLSLLDKNVILSQAHKLGLGNFNNLDKKAADKKVFVSSRCVWNLN